MNARTLKHTSTLNATLIAALLAVTGAAQAGHGDRDGFTTRARVLSSVPTYETINEPRRECWTETVGYETRSYRDGSNTGGAILGAIAGGLIGSTVGKGDGRVAAAAVGAATGAVVGDRWNGTHYESVPQQVERCRTHNDYRQVVTGYDVRYRFQGREYITHLPYNPGKWLTLDVDFSVAEDRRDARWHSSRNDWND